MTIKCCDCQKFISYDDLDSGKATREQFMVMAMNGYEPNYPDFRFYCKKCSNKTEISNVNTISIS